MNRKANFDIYVESYKKLPLQEKKQLVINEIKKLLAFIDKSKEDLNIKDELMLNKEILDLNSSNINDEDFVEGMFVYVYSIQESLGKYFNEVEKKLYK